MTTIPSAPATSALTREELAPLPGSDDAPPRTPDPLDFPGYAAKLETLDDAESVGTGLIELAGEQVVVAIGDFSYLGGSMGQVHGDRVAAAMAVALERRLPFLAVISSGGARMQEGMVSLMQMARATEGVRRLRAAGLPVLAHFTHPTTGGVHASYGAAADIVIADEGATVGFAGPRVAEAFIGEPIGDDSHTAETAHEAGLVDQLTPEGQARAQLTAWIELVHPARRDGPLPAAAHVPEPTIEHDAWDAVQAARHDDRPSGRDLLAEVFDAHLELHGDRAGADDAAAISAVARLGERRVVVLGFDRRGGGDGSHGSSGRPTAAGFRKLRRGAELAARWGMPLVTLIDTSGADPSPESDLDGLAVAISETFIATLDVPAPTIAVVTGEGGSGGALAIGACDRLLMQDDAVFEVIAPEGAASILHRDAGRAEEVAPRLRPTASDLRELGVCDRIVPGPITFDPATAARALRDELAATLADLDADPDRLDARRRRYG